MIELNRRALYITRGSAAHSYKNRIANDDKNPNSQVCLYLRMPFMVDNPWGFSSWNLLLNTMPLQTSFDLWDLPGKSDRFFFFTLFTNMIFHVNNLVRSKQGRVPLKDSFRST